MKPLTKKRAIELMRNQRSALVKMHTSASTEGFAWYVIPGGPVSQEVAVSLLARPDIKPGQDGLWPSQDQTWRMI